MDQDLEQTNCQKCDAILLEPKGSDRTPCPVCGETVRIFYEQIEEILVLTDQMTMKGKHGSKGRPFFVARVGASFYFKDQEWHRLERIIDRDKDLYIEIITNPKTGEVIRKVEEPLSQHQGHGSAKAGSLG